ncbi:MAG: hypothetical protein RLZZ458_1631 [Planctomycetota bacterium]
MKLALIGSNLNALPLLQELQRCADIELTASAISGPLLDQCAGRIPLQLAATSEDALLQRDLQLVLLALDDCDEILRLTRAAVQADRHVAVCLPLLTASAALVFELQLIADEAQTAVLPIVPRWQLRDLPPTALQLGLVPGEIRQLLLELSFGDATPEQLTEATRTGLDLLSAAGFRYSQVTCLDAAAPGGLLLSRLITLGAQADAESPLPPATLQLRPESGGTGMLRAVLNSGSVVEYPLVSGEADVYFPRLRWFMEDRARAAPLLEAASTTLELCEAAAKSVRRRRTVDVHFDAGTERSVFKSQMTAMGCGVLTWLMFSMVVLLMAGQLFDLPDWFWRAARVLWIAPVVLFLAAQFLLPLARDRSGPGRKRR